jgi:hypothetical protein
MNDSFISGSGTDPIEEYHNTVISNQWNSIAAFAWQSYAERGRGIVRFLDFPPEAEAKAMRGQQMEVSYLPFSAEMMASGDMVANWVKTYEPDESIIAMVVQTDGLHAAYLMFPGPGRPTPRQAAQAVSDG